MNYSIDDELIERIRDSSNIVEIVSRYINLKKTGSNYVGLCPFHSEKTPSFTVSETKQFFHCFGCGEGGDLISFIMKIENLSFVEAVKLLADQQGIILEQKSNGNDKLRAQKETLYRINREAAIYFYQNLINNTASIKYLSSRNVSKNMINQFGLGYAPGRWDGVFKHLKTMGFKEIDIEKAGLIGIKKDKSGYYDRFRNRIMFPIKDLRDRVIGFGGRSLDDAMPKYLNSKDTITFSKGDNLYGLNLIKKRTDVKTIVLVEGYMDVITLYRNGIENAVASLGTAFTTNQAKLLKQFKGEVYICYDSDMAGQRATIRAIELLRKEGIEPRIMLLPPGQDPDDFINKHGAGEFTRLINMAMNHIDFKIFTSRQKYNLKNLEERVQFAQEASTIIKSLKSPIEKEIYIEKISSETGIGKNAIEQEVLGKDSRNNTRFHKDKYINGRNRHNKNKIMPIRNVLEPAHLTAEKILLRLMIIDKRYYFIITRFLDKEGFLDYENNALARIICLEYENNPYQERLDDETILERIKQNRDIKKGLVKEIMEIDIDALPEDKEKLIEDLIKRMDYTKLVIERKQILENIQGIESKKVKQEGDVNKFRILCLRLMELDKELKPYI